MASSRGPGGGQGHQDLTEEERLKLKAKVFGVIRAALTAATKHGILVEKLNRKFTELHLQCYEYLEIGSILKACLTKTEISN